MSARFFTAYLKYRYGQANALTPGQQLDVVRRLKQEAREQGRVPLSETTTAVLPVGDPRVQAVLRGEPIAVGKATITSGSRPKSGAFDMDFQSWPLWGKIAVLLAIPVVVFAVGLLLLMPHGSSKAAATPTVTIVAEAASPTSIPLGAGGQAQAPSPDDLPTPAPSPTPFPTPAPQQAVPDNLHPAENPLGVTAVEIAGNRFVLSAGRVDEQGLWVPEGPEWLDGTVVRPVVAIPASMLDTGVLQPGLPIVVRRRGGQMWTYALDSVVHVARTQTEVMYQDRPGLVIVLVPAEPEDQRTVILGSPEFDVHPTPTPLPASSETPRKVRAVVSKGPLRLHATPSLSSKVDALLKTGTVLYIIVDGPPITADGYSWVHVWVPDGTDEAGTTGWVVERFLALPNLYP